MGVELVPLLAGAVRRGGILIPPRPQALPKVIEKLFGSGGE